MSWYKKSELDDMNKGGDCYESAGRYFMDNYIKDSSLILVHGIVIGQGKISGVKYGHAWIERGDTVLDYSNGRNLELPKILYYSLGNIDESKLFRYNGEKFADRILEHETWGPWDLESEF